MINSYAYNKYVYTSHLVHECVIRNYYDDDDDDEEEEEEEDEEEDEDNVYAYIFQTWQIHN